METVSSFRTQFWAYLELMRPANIVTAFADILAGYAAVGAFSNFMEAGDVTSLGWLLVSTFGLYSGGVVLNDVFDAELDAEERPERAIPSGRASRFGASLLGMGLLLLGIIAAWQVTVWSFVIAIGIVCSVVIYDSWAKQHIVAGPLFMGLCRGGNLLLGASVFPLVLMQFWYLALIPIIYIASITLVSQGEVHGGKRSLGFIALGLIVVITASLFMLALVPSYSLLTAAAFIAIFAVSVFPPFYQAADEPIPEKIKEAVKRGVLSQVILDSVLAAGFGGIVIGGCTLLLLGVSMLLAKLFSVT